MDFFFLSASYKPKDIGRRYPQIVSDFPGDFFPVPWKAESTKEYIEDPSLMKVSVSNSIKQTSLMSSARIVAPWFIGNGQLLSYLDRRMRYKIPRRPLTVKFKDGDRQYFVFKLKVDSFFDWFDPNLSEAGYKLKKFHEFPYSYDGKEQFENRLFGLQKAGKNYWKCRFDLSYSSEERYNATRALAPMGCSESSIITTLKLKKGMLPPPIICLESQVICTSEFKEACEDNKFTGMILNPLLGTDHTFDDEGVMIVKGSDRLRT